MSSPIAVLIEKQEQAVAALRKRVVGIDAMLTQGTVERNNLIADVLEAEGRLIGLKDALAATLMPEAKQSEQERG